MLIHWVVSFCAHRWHIGHAFHSIGLSGERATSIPLYENVYKAITIINNSINIMGNRLRSIYIIIINYSPYYVCLCVIIHCGNINKESTTYQSIHIPTILLSQQLVPASAIIIIAHSQSVQFLR